MKIHSSSQEAHRRRRRRRRGGRRGSHSNSNSYLQFPFSISISISILLIISCFSACLASEIEKQTETKSNFDESLTLKPLSDGKLLAAFSFKLDSIASQILSNFDSHLDSDSESESDSDSDSESSSTTSSSSKDPLTSQNFNLLPRQLIQIARSRNVKELHLSLNTGRWDYHRWGFPIFTLREQEPDGRMKEFQLGEENVASGAQMWARLIDHEQNSTRKQNSSPSSIQPTLMTRWRSLTSSLAGLFCASLDALDSKLTSIPSFPEIFSTTSPSDSSSFPSSSSSSSKSSKPTSIKDRDPSTTLLHGFLPSENICTENLTPFLKSLPCKNKAGLSTLLAPHQLFGSDFHGMSIHLWKVHQGVELSQNEDQGEDGEAGDETTKRVLYERGWKVELNFHVVFSPALKDDIGRRDWSLSDLFKKKLETSCPLADTSVIRVLKPPPSTPNPNPNSGGGIKQLSVKNRFVLNPLPPSEIIDTSQSSSDEKNPPDGKVLPNSDLEEEEEEEEEEEDEEKRERDLEIRRREESSFYQKLNEVGHLKYDVSDLSRYQNSSLDLAMSWPGESVFEYPERVQPPLITAERSFKGYGQERGTIELRVRNNQLGKELNVLYFEQLPWFVKPLLHTMKTEVIEDEFDESSPVVHFTDDLTLPILKSIEYQPSVPRESPCLIESSLRIPGSSSVILTYEFEKAFLRYMEHPPDAHRGFDLPPAIIKVIDPDLPQVETSSIQLYDDKIKNKRVVGKKKIPKIYTTTSLVELAVPDFSMPYNVIIMTSTVIALFFGSVFNNLVRTYKDLVVDASA